MSNILVLPIAVPLTTASVCLLAWNRTKVQRSVSQIGIWMQVVAAIIVAVSIARGGTTVLAVGGWQPPFGIVLVGDALAAVLVCLTALIGLVILADSRRTVSSDREAYGYHPLIHVLLMGVNGAFLTGDLFNLYVWFEVLLISSFVLLSLGAERAQLEASLKYVTLNLIASSIFLCALGLLYASIGTLNLADLSRKLAAGEGHGFGNALSMMFLVAFSLKAGLVPLQAWLPASYHTPPANTSALFAALLTKVGVVALVKIGALGFWSQPELFDTALAWMAGGTLLFSALGALVQNDLRRLLAFAVMNSVGAMIMGLALRSEAGYAATIFYLIHSAIASAAAYLLANEIYIRMGTFDLRYLGGLARSAPKLYAAWMIVAFSLAGLPPLSGFFGKYGLVRAGIEEGANFSVAALLLSSLLMLAAFLRVWAVAFARPGEEPKPVRKLATPALLLTALIALCPLWAPIISRVSANVGRHLSDPESAANVVLQTPGLPRKAEVKE